MATPNSDSVMLMSPRDRELVETCGGWARIICQHEECGKIYTVPFIDAGKQSHCSKCGKTNRIPAELLHLVCGCGFEYRLSQEMHGAVIRCKHCDAVHEITDDNTTIVGAPKDYIYFECPNEGCHSLLLQNTPFAGRGVQCPSCEKGIFVPTASTVDPIQQDISIRDFQLASRILHERCPICDRPIVETCDDCEGIEVTEECRLLVREEEVLRFLRQPGQATCVALALGEGGVDVADTNFRSVGTIVRLQFCSADDEVLDHGVFRVKAFSPFITDRRILRIHYVPLPDVKTWHAKREKLLAAIAGETMDCLFLAEEK